MPLDSRLIIETALRKNKTVLHECFFTQPLKIANITEDKSDNVLRLMLMSSSPGILDGDSYDTKIVIGEDCSLQLETQSYQRIFTMRNGAIQHNTVRLLPKSSFVYLPHPLVPHQDAIMRVRNKIIMNEGCSLLWGEVISCGRKMNGEIFRFSLYHGVTEIFLNNKLVMKENLRLVPGEMNLNTIGQLEGFTHQATLLFVNEQVDVASLTDRVNEALREINEISFGVSALPVNGLIVRLLGHKAEQLFALLKKLSLLLQTKQIMISENLVTDVV